MVFGVECLGDTGSFRGFEVSLGFFRGLKCGLCLKMLLMMFYHIIVISNIISDF